MPRDREGRYQYLLLDGITLKVKGATGVKKRLVLCAYGITPEGCRELLSFRQGTSESETQREAFLGDLYGRGLYGKELRLVTTDGCPGLHRALDTVYPYVPRQRCCAHKLRNVAARLPRKRQETCLQEAEGVYQSQTHQEAVKCFRGWAERWRELAPRAVTCPKEHWKQGTHYQRHRTGLQGGAPQDQAYELLPKLRQCGPDYLRRDQSPE